MTVYPLRWDEIGIEPLELKDLKEAASRGWRLLPVAAHSKAPLIKQWQRFATSSVCQLHTWKQQFPGCNWGMATGPDSGVFVIDLDGDAGLNWLKERVDAGDALPETWSVRTARGLHLYFEWPADVKIANSTSKLANGVDIRGAGGYVLIAPSVHPGGTRYRVVDDRCPVSPAPPWLLDWLRANTAASLKSRPIVPVFEIIHEGRRNDALMRNGGYLRRKGWSQSEIETELLNVNQNRCRPPLPDTEVFQIAASVARYPVGGPDPLESAWNVLQSLGTVSGYSGFIALAQTLQSARPDLPVALPLKRIAALFDVHFTSVQQWRKRAVVVGSLKPVGQYIAHRRAGTYDVVLSDSVNAKTLTKTLSTITTGLVRDCGSAIVRADTYSIVRAAESDTSFEFGHNKHFTSSPLGISPALPIRLDLRN